MNTTQSDFVRNGEYFNEFDNFGNLVVVENSEKYLSITLSEEIFEEISVSSIYNLNIEEFKEVGPVVNTKVLSLESEKLNLQKRIDDLSVQLSNTDSSEKENLINASRDMIVSLRVKLGEGKLSTDFNDTFPYLPLKSAEAQKSDASGVSSQSDIQSTSSATSTTSTVNNASTTSTTVGQTTSTQTSAVAQEGVVCKRQEEIQLVPPSDITIPHPPGLSVTTHFPIAPAITEAVKIVTPPIVSVPIHQAAVAVVQPTVVKECLEKFYKSVKDIAREWTSMLIDYGVISDTVKTSSNITSGTLTYQVYYPSDGKYTYNLSADNNGTITVDGVKIMDLNVTPSSNQTQVANAFGKINSITRDEKTGWKTVTLFYQNWGSVHAVAAQILFNGRIQWHSRMAYNAKDFADCNNNVTVTPPCTDSTKIYSFSGQVDHTLKITLKGTTYSYSDETFHGSISKTSTFFNNGITETYPDLILKKTRGRGNVTISQQPSSKNGYTAIIDISDSKSGEDGYSFELYQWKCSKPAASGGGGCPAVWQLMETKELGVVEARHIRVGMHLKDSEPGVWNRVNVAYIDVAPIYRVDIGGQVFDVDHSHKWYMGDDNWKTVVDIREGDFVEDTNRNKIKVNSVQYLKYDQYMHMNVDRERYVMGTNIIGHNNTSTTYFRAQKF